MFLFGLFMGRRGFFDQLDARRNQLWGAMIAGLVVGILAFAGHSFFTSEKTQSSMLHRLSKGLLWSAHAWGLAIFYASTLLLLLRHSAWRQRLAPLGGVGRMALTHYLLQAGLLVPICLTFDLFGRVTPSMGVIMAIAVWSLQVPASTWWLRQFRFGPAEWLWRSLTYGRPQPMNLEQKCAAATDA
jgi:uncharacterized protein